MKSLKILNIIIIVIFLFSCHSTNKKDFINFKEAFIHWYDDNHIRESYTFSNSYFLRNNEKLASEYIQDLKRLNLELSQLNRYKLSKNLQVDYDILNNKISELIFETEYVKSYQYTANDVILNIYTLVSLIVDNPNIISYKKILLLNNYISYIIMYIDNAKDNILPLMENEITVLNIDIDKLYAYLEEVPNLLNLDTINYSDLINSFQDIMTKLNQFKYWMNYESEYLNKESYINKKHIYEYHVNNIFKKSPYQYNKILKFINSNIITLENKIFDLCLQIYKINNDEPIWVDKKDTLHVINYVLDKNFKINNLNKTNLVNLMNNEFNKINIFIDSLQLSNYNKKYPIFIESKPYHITHTFTVSNNYKSIINKNYSDIFYNKYNLMNHIFDEIIPKNNIYNSLLTNKDQLRSIRNENYDSAISTFIYNVLVDNYYEDDILYELYFYINLLRTNIKIICQDHYIYNTKSKNHIIKDLKTIGFMGDVHSNKTYNELILIDNIYIESFIIYLHFMQIYEGKCLKENQCTASYFIDYLLDEGYVPYYLIN